MSSRLRSQILLASTVVLASIGVAVAAITATTGTADAVKGDRLDWSSVAEEAEIDIANPEPGLTVIARQP